MKDFLYHGASSVFQENLDSFLAIADELQLDGLKETQRERVPEENRSLATKTASTFAKDIVFRPLKTKSKPGPMSNIDEKSKSETAIIHGF